MQLDQLGILSYVIIIHQPVTVSSNTCSQMEVQIKHSPACLQGLLPTLQLVGVFAYMFIPAKVEINYKSCRCAIARECFICTCVWLHVHV